MSLNEEDKAWIIGQLSQFAKTLKLEFATREDLERFATREDLERFATKKDLERYATREDLERVETNLLTEFHKWASPIEARQRTHSAALRAVDAELEHMDDRVKKIEGR